MLAKIIYLSEISHSICIIVKTESLKKMHNKQTQFHDLFNIRQFCMKKNYANLKFRKYVKLEISPFTYICHENEKIAKFNHRQND